MSDCFSNQDIGSKLWLFWKDELQIQVLFSHLQHITLFVIANNQRVLVSVIYAKCNAAYRCILWSNLQQIGVRDNPWFLMRDFNIIQCDNERQGGSPRLVSTMNDFNQFIDSCGLVDIPVLVTLYPEVMDMLVEQEVGLGWINVL